MTIHPATDADVAQAKRHKWKRDDVMEYLKHNDKCKVEMKADSHYSRKCAAVSLRAAALKLGMKLAIYRMTYGLLIVKK